jgi:hypothetical protein
MHNFRVTSACVHSNCVSRENCASALISLYVDTASKHCTAIFAHSFNSRDCCMYWQRNEVNSVMSFCGLHFRKRGTDRKDTSHVVYALHREYKNFPKCRSHLKILGATRVVWIAFRTEDPQISGATVQQKVINRPGCSGARNLCNPAMDVLHMRNSCASMEVAVNDTMEGNKGNSHSDASRTNSCILIGSYTVAYKPSTWSLHFSTLGLLFLAGRNVIILSLGNARVKSFLTNTVATCIYIHKNVIRTAYT